MVLLSNRAFANDVDFTCSATPYQGALCKDGNSCVVSEDPVDNLDISLGGTGFVAGDKILFSYTHYDGAPPNPRQLYDVDLAGSGSSGGFSNTDTFTAFGQTLSEEYTITPADIADGTANIQIQISNSDSSGDNYARISYEVSCLKTPPPQEGSITIIKNADAGGTFSFNTTNFNLPTNNDLVVPIGGGSDSKTVSNLAADGTVYTVQEQDPTGGFDFTSVSCLGGANIVEDQVNRSAAITLNSQENVFCTFTNTQQVPRNEGKIIITKNADAGGTFNFTTTNFNLPGGNSITIPAAGGTNSKTAQVVSNATYEITEDDPTNIGFTFMDLQCFKRAGDSNITVIGRTAEIELLPPQGELDPTPEVECIYSNEKQQDEDGKLTVEKETSGGDYSFAFSGALGNFNLSNGQSKSSILAAGQHTVKEQDPPAGWSLVDISCRDTGGGPLNNSQVVLKDLTTGTLKVDLAPGEDVTCKFTNKITDDPPMEDITKLFIKRRVDNLLTHGPHLRRRQAPQQGSLKDTPPLKFTGKTDNNRTDLSFSMSLRGLQQSAMARNAQKIKEAKEGAGGLGLADEPYAYPYGNLGWTPNRFDIWTEGHINKYDDNTGGYNRDGDFSILYLGADYALTPNLVLGALVQFDWTSEDVNNPSLAGDVSGNGWMFGPYAALRLTDHLYFNARAAWGKSDNDILLVDPVLGTRTGSFDTDRWLISGELIGNWYRGNLRMSPAFELAYGNEDQKAYVNSNGALIGSNDISLGRAKLGTEFGYATTLESGTIVEPVFGIEGIWNFGGNDVILSNGYNLNDNLLRARIEGGVVIGFTNGVDLRVVGDYDGIGQSNFEAYGVQGWLNIPFN